MEAQAQEPKETESQWTEAEERIEGPGESSVQHNSHHKCNMDCHLKELKREGIEERPGIEGPGEIEDLGKTGVPTEAEIRRKVEDLEGTEDLEEVVRPEEMEAGAQTRKVRRWNREDSYHLH